jgi:hypothetical protein
MRQHLVAALFYEAKSYGVKSELIELVFYSWFLPLLITQLVQT